jgi:hypothetical protein
VGATNLWTFLKQRTVATSLLSRNIDIGSIGIIIASFGIAKTDFCKSIPLDVGPFYSLVTDRLADMGN